MRLDKYLSNYNNLSRTQAKELIKKRVVTVNGVVAKLFDMSVSENDSIFVGEKEIIAEQFVYIMMNKPAGVVCSTSAKDGKNVIDILPEELLRKNLFPAGRLDKDTEGFLIITDDGKFAHDFLSPKKHVDKVYFARLEKPFEESYVEAFESGIVIDGNEKCKPAKILPLEKPNEVLITISEGKFHQIKRMAHSVGNEIIYLKRTKIGNLDLDQNLASGESRKMLHKEVLSVYNGI